MVAMKRNGKIHILFDSFHGPSNHRLIPVPRGGREVGYELQGTLDASLDRPVDLPIDAGASCKAEVHT
jgi:hypothetical protein